MREQRMGNIPRESLDRLVFFRREMERILRDFFEAAGEDLDGDTSAIPVDIVESAEEVVITAELPACTPEGLSVEVSRDRLAIECSKSKEHREERARYICAERPFGKFRRIIQIPTACDTRRITAVYSNGVLTARIPRISERREVTRKVDVKWEQR
jgi:HSP20 family protein